MNLGLLLPIVAHNLITILSFNGGEIHGNINLAFQVGDILLFNVLV